MQVLIIADDLTGALDSGVQLAAVGLRCVVARRPADVPAARESNPDVLVINTASREGSAAQARASIAAALIAAGSLPPHILKKVDSRLKGHVAAELGAIVAGTGRRRALIAPAVPAQGRQVVGARLIGSGVAVPIDIPPFLPGDVETEIPDAATDDDLDRALAGTLDAPGEPLLVGAAGLAGALARRLVPGRSMPPPQLETPMLMAIGSRDPITLAQVAALDAAGAAAVATAPDGACPGLGMSDVRLIRLTVGATPFDAAVAGPRFASGVATIVAETAPAVLFACGGETADAILGALGTGVLEVEGEVLPGVPVSRMRAGGRAMRLVTKSGGFGAADALVSIAADARARAEERAG